MDASKEIIDELMSMRGTSEKKKTLQGFFKTGKGEYGEGDQFLGITVPITRQIAKAHVSATMETIESLLSSIYHEIRLCALLILVIQFQKNKTKRAQIYNFYLAHTTKINNWDLVDLSAPQIVGSYLLDKPKDILFSLVRSKLLWERRIAIVATLTFVRHNQYETSISLAKVLLNDTESLLHKATGWVLREIGKHDEPILLAFLDEYATRLPRTTLRYAIERLSPELKSSFMKRSTNRFAKNCGAK